MKTDIEYQFLPAVLEIQETPPSPTGRTIAWLVMLFFISALVWAVLGKVDIVAIASGKIIPDGHVKVIQPLEIGIIKSIFVRADQAVKKGDLLIEMDPSQITAEISQLNSERTHLTRQISRLQWLIQQNIANPDHPVTMVLNKSSKDEVLILENDLLLQSQWLEYLSRIQTLESAKNKYQAEYQSAVQQAKKLEAILPIISQRAASEKILVDKQMFALHQHLETEQQRLATLYDLKTQHSHIDELEASLSEISNEIQHTRDEVRKTSLETLEEARHHLQNTDQELIKAHTRAQSLRLTAPIDGYVQQLSVHTLGGIVTPAQELMKIVPDHSMLEIEAYISNKDIGFVHEGDAVAIKIDAFPFTRYGIINGKIIALSNDAITDEDQGLIYSAKVQLEETQIKVEDKHVNLSPGMTVSVEVKTGTRRLIEFFLAPLLRYKDESIRER